MSQIEAFICDYKNHLVTADRAVGLIPVEDAFDKLHSFPSFKGNPNKCKIHYCLDCYRDYVLTPAANLSNRKKDEEGYKKKVLELAYGVRQQTVQNFRDKNRFSHAKKNG